MSGRFYALIGFGLILGTSGCDFGGTEDEANLNSVEQAVANNSNIDNVQTTYYVLAEERNLQGQRTGDATRLCNHPSFPGTCYYKEFLCSGYGLPMQGTGLALNGNLVHYINGGTPWGPGNIWLSNCNAARFQVVQQVTGAAGRVLVPDFSIAVDPDVIALGWYVWVDTEGHWFRADDTGGDIDNNHIDLYEGLTGRVPRAAQSRIFATSTVHGRNDPAPCGFVGRPACNQPPWVGNHTYRRTNIITRTVTVDYRDPETQAPTVKRIQYRYNDTWGTLRFGSGDFALWNGVAGNGTYRWSRNITGTQFKFYTEWRDAGGINVRYPAAGWIE